MQFQDPAKQKRYERYLELKKKRPYSSSTNKSEPKESILDKAMDAGTAVTNFLGGKAVADTFGAEIAKRRTDNEQEKEIISQNQPGVRETVGSAIQLGSTFIPGAATTSAVKNIGLGAATGYLQDIGSDLQEGRSTQEAVIPGVGTAIGAATGGIGTQAVKGAGAVANTTRQVVEEGLETLSTFPTKSIDRIDDFWNNPGAIREFRKRLTNIDPQFETVLQKTNSDELNRYYQQAVNANLDPAKATPLELAGEKAVEAYNQIDNAIIKATQGKKTELGKFGRQKFKNFSSTQERSLKNKLGQDFGAEINAKGDLTSAKGSEIKLGTGDQKIVSEYYSNLKKLGDSPTAKQVDDFVDKWQAELYKLNTPTSRYEAVDKAVTSMLKGELGKLNSNLKTFAAKTNGSDAYSKINQRLQDLLEIQEKLNRSLGQDAKKGGSLMKRVFSPSDGGTKELFEQIRKETGIDLTKEATLAKFVMETVGDPRQKSLLQQLDVAINEAARVNLAEPGSWVKWIRERLDVDPIDYAREQVRNNN